MHHKARKRMSCDYGCSIQSSLDFTVVRFGMHVFKSAVAKETCMNLMGLELPSVLTRAATNIRIFVTD